MNAEVISIGDELTSGQRLDTNSQWLSQRLSELGIRVLYHTTVGDDLAANAQVFRIAAERAELLIATGGLGPTADDLTRDALAMATGTELVLDEGALAHIKNLFSRRKREMPERNIVQAMFPRGSRVVPNPHGSAPGIEIDFSRPDGSRAKLFALPGVPAEMYEMWNQTVSPAICDMLGERRRVIQTRTIRCFGVGESDLEAMLPDMIRRGRQPTVGITVSKATISLRIVAEGSRTEECQQQIDSAVETIQQCLGTLIFGEAEDELSHAVIRLLAQRNMTVATAEGGSGGLLSHWLSDSDPMHRSFVGGVVYHQRDLHNPDAVRAVAEETRTQFKADFGLALSDFPASDAQQNPPGSIHIGLAAQDGTKIFTTPFAGHPEILKPRAVKQALNALRLKLITRRNEE
jgi:nicotinamide-nucleotide amidase